MTRMIVMMMLVMKMMMVIMMMMMMMMIVMVIMMMIVMMMMMNVIMMLVMMKMIVMMMMMMMIVMMMMMIVMMMIFSSPPLSRSPCPVLPAPRPPSSLFLGVTNASVEVTWSGPVDSDYDDFDLQWVPKVQLSVVNPYLTRTSGSRILQGFYPGRLYTLSLRTVSGATEAGAEPTYSPTIYKSIRTSRWRAQTRPPLTDDHFYLCPRSCRLWRTDLLKRNTTLLGLWL